MFLWKKRKKNFRQIDAHPDILQLTKNLIALTAHPAPPPPPPPKPKKAKPKKRSVVAVQPPPPPEIKQAPPIPYDELPDTPVDAATYQSLIDKRKAKVAASGGKVKVTKKLPFLR